MILPDSSSALEDSLSPKARHSRRTCLVNEEQHWRFVCPQQEGEAVEEPMTCALSRVPAVASGSFYANSTALQVNNVLSFLQLSGRVTSLLLHGVCLLVPNLLNIIIQSRVDMI